jgi:hypothetical protein
MLAMTAIPRKLLGESLREIGVLVLIFVPLNLLISPELKFPLYPHWLNWLGAVMTLEHMVLVFFAVTGVAGLYFGIRIESSAEEELSKERR